MKINKCKKCGEDIFLIQEIIFHKAVLCPKNKDLNVYKDHGSGIERIFCKNCEMDYSEDNFKSINFK